jgi:AAA+ ATPase superfamily predicted ATPase
MLFDPRPKETRSELFNRAKELTDLEFYVKSGSPLILCLGVRRIGKTSLLKVFLNENNYPHIYINARKLSEYQYSILGLYKLFSEALNQMRISSKLVDYLKSLSGIKISALGTGFNIEFDWRRRSPSLTSLLERLNEYASERNTYFLIVIDEVQELRFLRGHNKLDFRQIMAYCYDNLRYIKFVLSGSEVGLLYDFLEFDNYASPLYGRVRDEIVLSRFSKEDSIRFLEIGFNEVGMYPPKTILEEVVNVLNGIPGWLAFYGYKAVQNKRFDILDRVLEEAIEMASGELDKIIKYGKLYKHILRAIAMGYKNWSAIKRGIEVWTGMRVHNKTLYYSLGRLMNLSILVKENEKYEFADPIHREATKKLTL